MSFPFKIITPKGIYLEAEADILNLPLTKGLTGILPHHFPLVSMIETGLLTYRYNGNSYEYAISGGIVHVGEKETIVLADAIESKEEIDIERAKQAEQRAKERLSNRSPDIDIERAELALKRAINRLKVANE